MGTGLAIGAGALLGPAAAQADTFTVDTTGDPVVDGCGTGTCSLREAIDAANANTGNPDTILFDSSLSGAITIGSQGSIYMTDSAATTIDGPGTDMISVDGAYSYTPLIVGAGAVADISGLTFAHGDPGGGPYGGAMGVAGTLTLSDAALTDSTAPAGAGLAVVGYDASADISSTTISGNEAKYAGGGFAAKYGATVTTHNTTISGNDGGTSGGGFSSAKYADVSLAEGTTVSGNVGDSIGGAGLTSKYAGLTVDESTITGNTGGLGSLTYIASTSGPTTPFADRAADRDLSGWAEQAVAEGQPAAARKRAPVGAGMTVTDSSFTGNTAKYGGGVAVANLAQGVPVVVEGTTFSGNIATSPDVDGDHGFGGGAVVAGYINGPVTFQNSTFAANDAGYGGALSIGFPYGSSASPTTAAAPAAGDSFAGLAATEARFGTGGVLALNSLTIAGNEATESGGGIYLGQTGVNESDDPVSEQITLINSIAGDNTAAGAPEDLAAITEVPGAAFQLTRSLVEAPGAAAVTQSPAGSSILGEDPQLSPLADNGGPTETLLPADTSPAVNAGGTGLPADQRGVTRPRDLIDDMGAVELQLASVQFTSGPTGKTKKSKPTFKFTADPAAGATFECSIDGGAFAACASPYTTPKLKDGRHVITVRAVTAEGAGTPVERSFKVDTKVKGLFLKVKKKQKAGPKKVRLKLEAGAGEKVDVRAKGKIVVKGKQKSFALESVTKSVKSGQRKNFKLKPKQGKKQKKIIKLLDKGKKLRAKLNVRYTDVAGNKKTKKPAVKLKLKK